MSAHSVVIFLASLHPYLFKFWVSILSICCMHSLRLCGVVTLIGYSLSWLCNLAISMCGSYFALLLANKAWILSHETICGTWAKSGFWGLVWLQFWQRRKIVTPWIVAIQDFGVEVSAHRSVGGLRFTLWSIPRQFLSAILQKCNFVIAVFFWGSSIAPYYFCLFFVFFSWMLAF